MRIKMVNPNGSTIEWIMRTEMGVTMVRQIDKAGTLRIPFPTPDLAGAWIITQAEYFRNEWSARYINFD